ncbi:hypothetical protein [uncultured Campylobacter sp.]|uniref:hypothetical protein n=1 Tax=uncultured Campylobacter sp. TaxID=218934 RepID=UPI00262DAB81|nr:hypothetical protein [uncultured Campylobacter sp.]
MRKLWKNPNSNARFAAAGFCESKFKEHDVKFYPYGAEPKAHDAALGGFKFRDEKFHGVKFATCGTEFLGANFRGMEFCKSKFRARGVKFYKARLRETDFLTRAAELYGTKFHEIKLQTPNSELKMKFGEVKFGGVKFRGGALFKFIAAKGLRRSPSLCAAPQNAGFFEIKFGETRFCDVKFHKARSRRAKFYAAEFTAKSEKFYGAKRCGVSA